MIRSALAAVALAALACSGAPSAAGPELPIVPAGTFLTILTGEDGRPLSGARVTVSGRTDTTDEGGRFHLLEASEIVVVTASGGGWKDEAWAIAAWT